MNIVYFILRHYYNEMGKRFNEVNVPQITGQTMNPLRTTRTMTHSQQLFESKKELLQPKSRRLQYFLYDHVSRNHISRYWVLFSIYSKNTFAFMNHTACFHLKFPQKYSVLPNCTISWFWGVRKLTL